MDTNVSIHHRDYPGSVRTRVERRMNEISRFYDRTVLMNARLQREKDGHRIELVAGVGHGAVLVADAHGATFEEVLEEALHRMGRLLSKHKDRLVSRRRRGKNSA